MQNGSDHQTPRSSANEAVASSGNPPTAAKTGQDKNSNSQPSPTSEHSPRKQKRNKPSLSCEACTAKKTKCDRVRPICLACLKRRSQCRYSELADLVEESQRALGIETPRKKLKGTSGPPLPPLVVQDGRASMERKVSRSSTRSSPMLLSNVPYSHQTASNVFKAEHPFSNYWTHTGGLPEVIGVLPSKEQADILIAMYFNAVDPVYPMIHRHTFQQQYESFWALDVEERRAASGSLIALIFVMLAMGTQFVTLPSQGKEQTAEFYVSASHRALQMSSYLSRPSMCSIQAMVLITYFLMNDNHADDAWAFAGILIRQAYAMGLNREPDVIVPNASAFEKQQRRKVWQAVLLQDTFFTVILKLPPTATHTDVKVENLNDLERYEGSGPSLPSESSDNPYIRSMWILANLAQETICSPRALSLPISRSASDRARVVARFHRIYATFPQPFRNSAESSVREVASRDKRLARQILFLTSNHFHCLMLVCADELDNMAVDVKSTLDAAHEAINSFFLLYTLFEEEAKVWYHFQHRAFSEALVIAELVKNKPEELAMDPQYAQAKSDVRRMVDILQINSEHDIVAGTRVTVLNRYL